MEELLKAVNEFTQEVEGMKASYEEAEKEMMESYNKGENISLSYIKDTLKNKEAKIQAQVSNKANAIYEMIPKIAKKEINQMESKKVPVTADAVAEIDAVFSLEDITNKDIQELQRKYQFNDVLYRKINSNISKYNKNVISGGNSSAMITQDGLKSKAAAYNEILSKTISYVSNIDQTGNYKISKDLNFSELRSLQRSFDNYNSLDYNFIDYDSIDKSYVSSDKVKEVVGSFEIVDSILRKYKYK